LDGRGWDGTTTLLGHAALYLLVDCTQVLHIGLIHFGTVIYQQLGEMAFCLGSGTPYHHH